MNQTFLTISDAPLTKTAVAQLGARIADVITEEYSALDAFVRLRAMRDALDAALGQLERDAMNEATSGDTLHGVKVQVRNGASRWDYAHDGQWQAIKSQEAALAEARKLREQFLQRLPADLVDPDTGEFVSPAVQTAMGNRTIALTFPKE
jgi:hypothetical protein